MCPRILRGNIQQHVSFLMQQRSQYRKASNVSAQSSRFSSYKHKNTLKTMIGVSQRSLVTFVSDSYAGIASDRQIMERSDLCKKDLFNIKKLHYGRPGDNGARFICK
jgi:hypothetical protein